MVMQSINPLEMSSLHIVYDNMSPLDEKEGRRGIFHLIEHLIGVLFEPILPDLHEYGIVDDFSTSHEHVVLSFTGTTEAIEKFAPKIVYTIASACSRKISKEMFEMERDAVFNEMRELGDDFYASAMRRALRKVYNLHAPEGDYEDVKAYAFKQFKKDFDRLVPHPTNICYVGPRSLDLPDLKTDPYKIIRKYPDFDYFKANRKAEKSDINPERDSVVISAFSMKPVTTNKEYAAINMACRMLGGDSDSALYNLLRVQDHLVYSCSASVEPFRSVSIPIFMTSASKEDVPKVLERMHEVLENPEKYLTEQGFIRCKHMFEAVLKQDEIMRFTAPGRDTRYGMITDELDIRDITYEYMLKAVRKYIKKGTFRYFAG